MNKYEKALNNVKIAPSFMGGNDEYRRYLDSSVPFLEDIATLQELVDKETPMKTFQNEYLDTHENVYVGICPKCKNENPQFKHQNYCWNCGQKLDWSD